MLGNARKETGRELGERNAMAASYCEEAMNLEGFIGEIREEERDAQLGHYNREETWGRRKMKKKGVVWLM